MYFLIDFENVGNEGLRGSHYLLKEDAGAGGMNPVMFLRIRRKVIRNFPSQYPGYPGRQVCLFTDFRYF